MNWFKRDRGVLPPAEYKLKKNERRIEIKQLGFTKVVIVRTKRNGGIKVVNINVKFA